MGTAEQHPAAVQVQRLRKLGQQSALAHAGLGHHGHRTRPAITGHAVQRRLQLGQLCSAPHHRRLHAVNAACGDAKGAWLGSLHQVAALRFGHTLDADQGLLNHLEQAAHMAVAVVADAQAAGRRALLHARGKVDGGAADAAFGVDPAAEQHGAGVHAGAHIEIGHAVQLAHQRRQLQRGFDDAQAGAHGAFDIVLMRLVGTKGGQHAVAGVLQHAAMVALHDGGEALQRAVHHGVDVFRAQLLADGRGADHIDEQYRDLLELLHGHRLARAQRRQLALQRGQGRIDQRVAEQRALRLQAGDGGFKLLWGVVHAAPSCMRWSRRTTWADSRGDFDVLDLARRRWQRESVFSQAFKMKLNGDSDSRFDFRNG